MLDTQIHMYALDTSHFYSNHEKYLHDKIFLFTREINLLKQASTKEENIDIYLRHKREQRKEYKERLSLLLSNRANQNTVSFGKDHIRKLREDALLDHHIISVFESFLTRTIGIPENTFTDLLMTVQIYYFDVFKDLCFYGFSYHGRVYRYFTSSAGQIRKKKAVFIEDTTWTRVEKTIMCGLTVDKINANGGNNVNKHLAYLALSNSATDEWKDFDINRCIVVEDFETTVTGDVDFIDDSDYSITRMLRGILITHTDGAGMILPSVMKRNCMFRAPWIKGLLGVFDFIRFAEEHEVPPVLTDIYGNEHHLIEENIQIIFTKSQFKMYRFYSSWEEYQHFFNTYKCTAGICNPEEKRIKNARINYQMLQTLTDITPEEMQALTYKSASKLTGLCSSAETMMAALGITPYNTHMNALQQAIQQYPPLLNDISIKDMLRQAKDSLLKKYRSGKLEIFGKYTYLLPDFYAACEAWFFHEKKPKGLLEDGEVYCRLFPKHEVLDCLRSPHLYREHALRRNAAASPKISSDAFSSWYVTDAIYTSSHDLISKLLQFDVDGDKALVVADETLITVAQRNMEGIVPLYYNMKQSTPKKLTPQSIYDGLVAAFTGAPIGTDSNDITKIWNSDVFLSKDTKAKQEALDCIKLLCMENNFHIDYAKTLYKPIRPKEKEAAILAYTKGKLPAFFTYAKDKAPSQITAVNLSFVNRIFDFIPNPPIQAESIATNDFDFTLLMKNKHTICDEKVLEKYLSLNRKYGFLIHQKDTEQNNIRYTFQKIRTDFDALSYSPQEVADMLVLYLYGNEKRYKQLLWFCYGSYLFDNLMEHTKTDKTKYVLCIDCQEWFRVHAKNSKACRCFQCTKEHRKLYQREIMRKRKHLA